MLCQYCKKTFCSKYVLQTHQKKTKYCLDIQKQIDKNNISPCSQIVLEECIEDYERRLKNQKLIFENQIKKEVDNLRKQMNESEHKLLKHIQHLENEIRKQKETYLQRMIDVQSHQLDTMMKHIVIKKSDGSTTNNHNNKHNFIPSNVLSSAHCS